MKKIRLCLLFIVAIISAVYFFKFNYITGADYTAEELDSSVYNLEKYTMPFWEGNIVYNECVFPILNENGELEPFDLMYDASEIVSVKNYSLDKEYVEGVDYVLDNGSLVILPTGSIFFRGYDYIHRDEVIDDKVESDIYPFYPRKDGEGYIYWTEDPEIFLNALSVTYIHNDKWDYSIPQSQKEYLAKTFSKLNNSEDINIVITGDSISNGCNVSGNYNLPPYTEDYKTMVKKVLQNKYDIVNVNIINSSIGGGTTDYTKEQLDESVIAKNPDLVIIALGMNDAANGMSAEQYRDNIVGRIDYISEKLPDCEILMVTSLYGNIKVFSKELYEEHAMILYEIAEENKVAICDPQAIMGDLLDKKDYLCFMADNMVHPNDYGMRIIAQCVIAALSE